MKKKLLFLFAALLSAVGAWSQDEDMFNTPLTLEAIETGMIKIINAANGSISIRINGGKEKTYEKREGFKMSEISFTINKGSIVEIYGDNERYHWDNHYSSRIFCYTNCYIYGNIMSLISSTDYATTTTLKEDSTFYGLFSNNPLNEDFYNPNSINLKSHPTKALLLPATTLTESCYYGMFDCTGLSLAPELPATILAKHCYSRMFSGCTELTKAPGTLPATTLTTGCYEEMFKGCAGLINAPELPATTLASSCYDDMFKGCAGLTNAPELPAMTLASSCYSGMFSNCTGLTKAPELPATTLASSCYSYMFIGCTGLTKAPELPATTLASSCYRMMFSGCTNLNNVTCLATDNSAGGETSSWLRNVSANGTFVKHPDMKDWPTGVSGIPEGWTVVDYDMTDINATTDAAKKAPTSTYDLRGMRIANKKGVKIVEGRKVMTK